MTRDDIDKLCQSTMREAVRANLAVDPMAIALSSKIESAALVASQVKYLQRAQKKLPSYYSAQCIIPSLAFEQSSSEQCAAHKNFGGELCIDLTCGLGVDSLYLARGFKHVISLERDPVLAHLACVNFKLLGVDNIEVVALSAEEFVLHNSHMRPDMIYADPDRRALDGRKLVCMEDCSPDMVSLIPQLLQMSDKVVIKCSPLFDVDRVFSLFADYSDRGISVEVLSLGGECKEVVVEIGGLESGAARLCATALGVGSFVGELRGRHLPRIPCSKSYKYLIVPDVALQKSRLAVDYFIGIGADIASDNSFAFADVVPDDIIGKVFEIETIEHYTPRKLKHKLREQGLRRLNILRRDFPQSTATVSKELGVMQGGDRNVAVTKVNGEPVAIFLR